MSFQMENTTIARAISPRIVKTKSPTDHSLLVSRVINMPTDGSGGRAQWQ